MTARWANPEHIGVIIMRDGIPLYLDSGPDYLAAIMGGVQEYAGPIQSAEEKPPPAPDPKMGGVEFEGVMCSATKPDQDGLAAVMVAIQLQGASFQPTRFYFENGSTLVITLENYQAFAAVWLPFRQSFFQP